MHTKSGGGGGEEEAEDKDEARAGEEEIKISLSSFTTGAFRGPGATTW